MSSPAPTAITYDELPYKSFAFPQTHPDRLATIARLFGLASAPPARCRVLEIGCASGGNLLPMAVELPDATFVGIDLSERQIAQGQAAAARAGLTNVELRRMDLAAIDASQGEFDYIVAHGVYSWIPREAQDQLLAACKARLAPNGVAYVSYNTYPGWRLRETVRDMLLFHTQRFAEGPVKVQQARALLDFMAASVPVEKNPYGGLLKELVDEVRTVDDSYFAHEYLAGVNAPVYFREFVERAHGAGLEYLGESSFAMMLATNFKPEVEQTLRKIAPGIVEHEQYMDYLRDTSFRQTLLVHQGATIRRDVDWRRLAGLRVASPLRPVSATPDLASDKAEQFLRPNDSLGLASSTPVVKAAMTILAERWPQDIDVGALPTMARARLAGSPLGAQVTPEPRDAEMVATEVLRCYASGLVDLRVEPSRLTTEVGERPRVSTVARQEAQAGGRVTNLRHEPIALDDLTRQVIQRLDGATDRDALIAMAEDLAKSGALTFRSGEAAIQDAGAVRMVLAQAIPQCLQRLAHSGFLLPPG